MKFRKQTAVWRRKFHMGEKKKIRSPDKTSSNNNNNLAVLEDHMEEAG